MATGHQWSTLPGHQSRFLVELGEGKLYERLVRVESRRVREHRGHGPPSKICQFSVARQGYNMGLL